MTRNILIILFVAFIVFVSIFVALFKSHKTITQNIASIQKLSATIVPKTGTMKITSSAFATNGTIPTKYTCDGKSINPPLRFEAVPDNAKSLVMLMDDPDVPKNIKPDGVFDHWVVYNISPALHEIKENNVPSGVSQGANGSGKDSYTGPCPPDREHRYFFKLYALDTMLGFPKQAKVTKLIVLDAMKGHIIEQAELIGKYNRPQNSK